MSRTVYDTRFFIEHYRSDSEETLKRTKDEIRNTKERYISTIVLHEVYKLTLEKEGRETAKLRCGLLKKDFKVMDVDSETACVGAELRHKYNIPMADSLIAATTLLLKAVCITDDPHFKTLSEIKTKWI